VGVLTAGRSVKGIVLLACDWCSRCGVLRCFGNGDLAVTRFAVLGANCESDSVTSRCSHPSDGTAGDGVHAVELMRCSPLDYVVKIWVNVG